MDKRQRACQIWMREEERCEGRPSQETGGRGRCGECGGGVEGRVGRWSGGRKESGLRWWAGLEAAVVVKPERWTGVVDWTGGQGKQRVRRRDQLTPVRAERAGRVVRRTVVVQDRAAQRGLGENSRQTGDVSLCWGGERMCDDETSVWEDETARSGGCG
jgi:hypothetical protein